MATMNETKKKLEEASKLERIKITKGGKDKILIDLNGDGEPEAALIDTTGSGRADLLAIDLTGDHKFNLFLDDTDDNSYPDVFYMDKKGVITAIRMSSIWIKRETAIFSCSV